MSLSDLIYKGEKPDGILHPSITKIQPMTVPSGLIWYMDFKFESPNSRKSLSDLIYKKRKKSYARRNSSN